jgi:chaperonin GroEL (HSP60 family)
MTPSTLAAALKPALASKQYGLEDPLAALISEAALAVMPTNPRNFNVDNVRVVKIMGGSLANSRVVQGMVFGREPEGEHMASAQFFFCLGVCLQAPSNTPKRPKWPCSLRL